MNEIDFLNNLLVYFDTHQHTRFLVENIHNNHINLPPEQNINIERLCEHLYEDGLCYKEQDGSNAQYMKNVYGISTKGVLFFNDIPKEYLKLPYTFYLIKLRETERAKRKKEDLELSNIKANLSVASSVTATNRKSTELAEATETFYTKQRATNNINIFLTIAILISSAIYTTVTILSFNESKHNNVKEQRLEELEKKLKDKSTMDSIFERRIKDSLKIP